METEGIAQFVAVRYAELLRTAYLLTGSSYAAEDLVQTCLLKAMSRWAEIEDPLPYLRRMMVNQRTSRWRRLRREFLSAEPPDAGTADPAAGVADRTALIAELARLPKRMRAVLVLRYWEDLSEADTADALGCSVGTVKSQASRGLARLRVLLSEPTQSSEPTHSSEPTQSSEPTHSSESTHSSEPADSREPAQDLETANARRSAG